MSISAAEAEIVLTAEFDGVTWYVGLRSGGVELSGDGYARVAHSDWSISGNTVVNGSDFAFAQATADWDTADETALYTASSGGAARYVGSLEPTVTVRSGQTREFATGDLTVRAV